MDSKFISAIKSEYTYLIPLGIWVFFSVFRVTLLFPYVEPYYVPISLTCMGFIVLQEIAYLKGYRSKDYIGAGIAFFMFITAALLREGTVMYSILCIFVARHTSIKKVLSSIFIATLSAFLITIASSQTGLVLDYFAYHGGRNRHYLGFGYALFPSAIFMNLIAIYVYLRNKKISFIESIILIIMAFGLFYLTDSRLAFILTVIIITIGYLLKYLNKYFKKLYFLKFIISLSMIFSALFAIGITYDYNPDNPQHYAINKFLGNRIAQGQNSLNKYGIDLFYRNIEFHGRALNSDGQQDASLINDYVDSFYVQYLQRYGVIFFVLFIWLYTKSMYRVGKNNDIYLLFIASVFAFDGIITDMISTLYYNGFLIMLGYILIDKKDSVSSETES